MVFGKKQLISFFMDHFLKDKRFYKFLFIGVINTIFGYSIYALFIFLHLHYTVAVLFATIIGILFNFKTIGKFVFQSSDSKLIFRFIGTYMVVYLINTVIIKTMLLFMSNLYFCGIFALTISAPVAFFLNKSFVFKGKYEIN